jgi:hypothetical protein
MSESRWTAFSGDELLGTLHSLCFSGTSLYTGDQPDEPQKSLIFEIRTELASRALLADDYEWWVFADFTPADDPAAEPHAG